MFILVEELEILIDFIKKLKSCIYHNEFFDEVDIDSFSFPCSQSKFKILKVCLDNLLQNLDSDLKGVLEDVQEKN